MIMPKQAPPMAVQESRTLPEMVADRWQQERPDLNQTGFGLIVRLRAMAMMIDHVLAEIAEKEAVQVEDLLLLFALRRVGPPYCLRPTEIYGVLNITSGAATYRIDRMVKEGLTERVDDPEDRRSYVLRISKYGMKVIDRAVEALVLVSDRALVAAEMDAVHLVAFGAALHRLERGWETVIPVAENPLSRRGTSLLQGPASRGTSRKGQKTPRRPKK
jgi:DNA-binding MarR family transcriptional regulator